MTEEELKQLIATLVETQKATSRDVARMVETQKATSRDVSQLVATQQEAAAERQQLRDAIVRLTQVQEGIANLLATLDEDRPTILRKLTSIENKVD